MITDEAYSELKNAVGEENITCEPAVLDTYAWQPTVNDNPSKWVYRPAAVVLPESTAEVQNVIRACNNQGLKFKAFSTGWGVYSAPASDGIVQIDMRRMNRILEIDEKNMYAVVEPYVCGAQLQAEAMKLGLNTHIIGAGPVCSPLASATSGWGVGWDSIYMSCSGRNVLGVEWVLPDGEVFKPGTPGSDLGWFSGDGPGPSLRGIMRGAGGALSGLGVFTRCAIKLFNWSGPPQLESEGLLLDNQLTEMPENIKFHICYFPDRESLTNATYKIGDEELGYLFSRTSVAAFLNTALPHLSKKVAGTTSLRTLLTNSLKWSFTIVLAGTSEGDIKYQESALQKILEDTGGMTMELTKIPVIGSVLLMNFLRASVIPMVFRTGGHISTVLSSGETWDTKLDWAEKGVEIKEKWTEDGSILDDFVDNPFMALYENNSLAHCENIIQYDFRNEKHLKALDPIFFEFTLAAIEKCMEPLSSSDARQRKLLSPLMGNYNRWQKSISRIFDPQKAADTGMYCKEKDFNLADYNPGLVKKMQRLVKERKWP